MAKLLLDYRGVPEDEIEEIRALLKSSGINTYETTPSRWAVSAGAIWLADDGQYQEARALLDEYQSHRSSNARADYLQRQAEGRNPTLIDKILEDPVRFILYLAAIGLILYFSVQPFLNIGN
jgi:hypothetical protein